MNSSNTLEVQTSQASELPQQRKIAWWLFTSSTCVLIVVWILFGEAVIAGVKPLNYFDSKQLHTLKQYHVVSKLPEFLQSANHPSVIMTGSSLFLYPSVRCDDNWAGRKTRYDAKYLRDTLATYNKSEYLEHLLSQAGQNAKVTNLATAAGLFSDQYMVFARCLSLGKKPKLAICDISPREFLDNYQPDHEKTPVYIVLKDMSSFSELLQAKASLATLLNCAVSSVSSLVRDRDDYKQLFVNQACRLSHHPANLAAKPSAELSPAPAAHPTQAPGPTYTAASWHGQDLDYYKKSYLPINEQTFTTQMRYLSSYLKLAKENQVAVLLVKMPLSKSNKDLLPPQWQAAFNEAVDRNARLYGASVVEPDQEVQFSPQDFEDSAHMNFSGGQKLFETLTKKIVQSKLLSQPAP